MPYFASMGPFKGDECLFLPDWPIRVRVRVSFTNGAVQSAILATAGLLVDIVYYIANINWNR